MREDLWELRRVRVAAQRAIADLTLATATKHIWRGMVVVEDDPGRRGATSGMLDWMLS